jgi:hypothetical protein
MAGWRGDGLVGVGCRAVELASLLHRHALDAQAQQAQLLQGMVGWGEG